MLIIHRPCILPIAISLVCFLHTATAANAGTITFEAFPDGTPINDSTSITTQFSGLTFSNTTVITAGISLNEFEFPPNSGSNVAFDDGGPISIAFDNPVLAVSGYFTYEEPLVLAAFDSSGDELTSATSAFSSNDALFGDPGSTPNEFLQVSSLRVIASVTITANPAGDSFVMDDLNVTPAVPEPRSIFLFLTGAFGIRMFRRKTSR